MAQDKQIRSQPPATPLYVCPMCKLSCVTLELYWSHKHRTIPVAVPEPAAQQESSKCQHGRWTGDYCEKCVEPAPTPSRRWIEGREIPEGESVLAELEYTDCGKPVRELVVVQLDEDSEDGLLTDAGDDVGWPTEAIVRWQKIDATPERGDSK